MFWLTIFKSEKNTNKASVSQLGLRWEDKMIKFCEKKEMKKEMKFSRQDSGIVFHVIFRMWLSLSSLFFSLQDGKMYH